MKRKFYLLLLVILIIFVIFIAGCLGPGVITERAKTIDLSFGTTVGNHTYLPLYLNDAPQDCVQEILQVLDFFEKAHPELEVTSWNAEASSGFTYGLWVNHRERN